jgi:hypothetical protein
MAPLAEQLSLPLFPAPTFAELTALHKKPPVTVTLNKRLKRGWRVTVERFTGNRQLVVPAYFADAPEDVKRALIEWAALPSPRRSQRKRELLTRRKQLEGRIWEHAVQAEPRSALTRRRDPAAHATGGKGAQYDLREVFDSVNRAHFSGRLASDVRWGSHASTTSYQSNRTDYAGRPYSLITIAGVYDHPSVPRFAIEAVMHHEMLHIALPPTKGRARRSVHSREFLEAEKRFPSFREWDEWQRDARRLAARMRRKKSRPKRLFGLF